MTPQDIFNKVAAHLLTQQKTSMREHQFGSKQCAYRGDDGCKCAVGCLIEDEEYAPWMEGLSIHGVVNEDRCPASLRNRFDIHSLDICRQLQFIHDNVDVCAWKEELDIQGERFGLKPFQPSKST